MGGDDAQHRFQLLGRLSDAFARREGDDGSGEELLALLQELERTIRPTVRYRHLRASPDDGRSLPRRVTTAMTLALHSQPHLATTWAAHAWEGTLGVDPGAGWPAGEPLVVSNDTLERALGVSRWESDELRDEVDRRAGRDMKQARALQWIWTQFRLPEASPWTLFRVLFPGLSGRLGGVDLLRHGGQLYAVLEDAEPPPFASLYLPWIAHDPERCPGPLTTFRSRYVDRGLRRAIARSIGAGDAEVDAMLDHMVTLLPRDRLEPFLALDRWRAGGPGTLTGLGIPYSAASWLVHPPAAAELKWADWLKVEDGALQLADEPRMLFDTLAVERLQVMMRQVYAALLARLHPAHPDGPEIGQHDLDLLDVRRHLEATLRPLLDWPRSLEAHQEVSSYFGVPPEHASRVLLELARSWEVAVRRSWLAVPDGARPHTVYGVLVQHLVALFASLRALAYGPPDPRADHRMVLLLFAGHYLDAAPVERLWLRGLSDAILGENDPVPPPEDIVGTWFWPCWLAVLDGLEAELRETFPTR